MMNFPDDPQPNDVWPGLNGVTYKWNGIYWAAVSTGTTVPEAPVDGLLYGRKDAGWSSLDVAYVKKAGDLMTGNLAIQKASPALFLDRPAPGTVAEIDGLVGGKLRWALHLGNGTAESGSNAGSDFTLTRCNDAGAGIAAPLSINRASGTLTVEQIETTRASSSVINKTGGIGGNTIFIGWGSGAMTARVDASDFGSTWPINISGTAAYLQGMQATPAATASTIASRDAGGQTNFYNIYFTYANRWFSSYWDWVNTVGMANNDPDAMYLRRAGDDLMRYIVGCNNNSVKWCTRDNGYIHFQTDIGGVGCNYFVSDERKKHDIEPSKEPALPAIMKVKFIAANYNEGTGYDPEVRHEVMFSAQNLQSVQPEWVNVMNDDQKTLMPNETFILPWLMKAVQELAAKVDALEKAAWPNPS